MPRHGRTMSCSCCNVCKQASQSGNEAGQKAEANRLCRWLAAVMDTWTMTDKARTQAAMLRELIYLQLCHHLGSSGPPVLSESKALAQHASQIRGKSVWDVRSVAGLQGSTNLSRVFPFKRELLGEHVKDSTAQGPHICRLSERACVILRSLRGPTRHQ